MDATEVSVSDISTSDGGPHTHIATLTNIYDNEIKWINTYKSTKMNGWFKQ